MLFGKLKSKTRPTVPPSQREFLRNAILLVVVPAFEFEAAELALAIYNI
jgi:hypothetical protein